MAICCYRRSRYEVPLWLFLGEQTVAQSDPTVAAVASAKRAKAAASDEVLMDTKGARV